MLLFWQLVVSGRMVTARNSLYIFLFLLVLMKRPHGALLPLLAMQVFAQCDNVVTKIGCKVVLDKNEYINEDEEFFIKASTVSEIFNYSNEEIDSIKSYQAWQMLEFKLFLYVECPYCHGLYLVDSGCTNPNCKKIN